MLLWNIAIYGFPSIRRPFSSPLQCARFAEHILCHRKYAMQLLSLLQDMLVKPRVNVVGKLHYPCTAFTQSAVESTHIVFSKLVVVIFKCPMKTCSRAHYLPLRVLSLLAFTWKYKIYVVYGWLWWTIIYVRAKWKFATAFHGWNCLPANRG